MPRRLTRRDFLSYAAMAAAAPIFEVKPLRGIEFLLQNSPTPRKFLIETMPGGIALFDYNNDGLLDIFLMNGGRITEGLHVPENFERSNPRYWNRLYRQNRDGSFVDVTQAAGLASAGNGNYGMGVAVGDYDNDGNADLYVTSYGKNILYHNNGDGTFMDVTDKAGVAGGGWSVSAGFFDYDNDGRLDLFVTRYMDWDADHNKICGGDWHTYCPPNAFPATTCLLYHNRGDGTFEDVTEKSGLAAKGRALGVAFADYDGDGFTDIFVANDGMQQYLFHNNGDGTFTECGLESGVAFTADGKGMSGMGTVFQDYDNDGRPDVLVTVLPREIYSLYHNEGGGSFNYASLEAGLGAMTSMNSGWGVGLEDFDNDGWKDLFVAQGHVLDNVQDIDASLRYKELPLIALNHKGRFERADSGVTKPVAARGVAFGDINNDGSMDAVISCLGGPPILLLNRGGGNNHWLSISLQGTRSNRDGYGARVSVNGQTRVATSTGSYLCANDKRLHFGLGTAEKATVEILWPSGVKQVLNDVRADQFLAVREPERS